MAASRLFWFLTLVLAVSCVGCGGGGGTATPASPTLKFSLGWAARSRATSGPSSALSAVVTLTGAKPGGGNYTAEIDRRDDPGAYTLNYNPGASSKVGTFPLTVRFYDQVNGAGDVVATGTASVTIDANGNGIGTVTTANTISSVVVVAGQTFVAGSSGNLAFTAKDAQNNIIAVSPGSALWTTGDATILSTTDDGAATAKKLGITSAQVAVDGITSSVAFVTVNNDPNGPEMLMTFDDLTLGGPFLQGTAVDPSTRLTNQYQSQFGATFTSAVGYCALVNLGAENAAPSPPNGFTAVTLDGHVTYDQANPIQIVFSDPLNANVPGVTKSVSVTGDLDGNVNLDMTLQAFDVNGTMIGQTTIKDAGGETFTVAFSTPRIHSVKFICGPVIGQDGAALDNVRIAPVVAAP